MARRVVAKVKPDRRRPEFCWGRGGRIADPPCASDLHKAEFWRRNGGRHGKPPKVAQPAGDW